MLGMHLGSAETRDDMASSPVVVFTDRGGRPLIIFARKAEPREEDRYFARFTLN
jgi:hypothetical protein